MVIDASMPTLANGDALVDALLTLCEQASEAVQGAYGVAGVKVIVLSDKLAGRDRIPIPSLLALGALHQHLIRTKQRPKVALFVECGDAREVHDFATLLGFGADGVCPYMAYLSLAATNKSGVIAIRARQTYTDDELFENYRKAAGKGLLKVMSKMGISTLQSYKGKYAPHLVAQRPPFSSPPFGPSAIRHLYQLYSLNAGAQVFEALGLDETIMERCFTGTSVYSVRLPCAPMPMFIRALVTLTGTWDRFYEYQNRILLQFILDNLSPLFMMSPHPLSYPHHRNAIAYPGRQLPVPVPGHRGAAQPRLPSVR